MLATVMAALIALGCQATVVQTPAGPVAVVLICPPPIVPPAASQGPEERQG